MESADQESCLYCAHNLYFHFCLVCGWTNCLPFISHQHKSGETFIHDSLKSYLNFFLFCCPRTTNCTALHLRGKCAWFYRKTMRLLPQIAKSRINALFTVTSDVLEYYPHPKKWIFYLLVTLEILFLFVLAVYLWKLQKSIWSSCQPIQQRGSKELHGGILHQYPSI